MLLYIYFNQRSLNKASTKPQQSLTAANSPRVGQLSRVPGKLSTTAGCPWGVNSDRGV